jgi:hypothetical protein
MGRHQLPSPRGRSALFSSFLPAQLSTLGSVALRLSHPAAEVAAAGSVLTLEQMRQQLQQLGEQKAAQGEKLAALKSGGARRVSAADVAAVEKVGWVP